MKAPQENKQNTPLALPFIDKETSLIPTASEDAEAILIDERSNFPEPEVLNKAPEIRTVKVEQPVYSADKNPITVSANEHLERKEIDKYSRTIDHTDFLNSLKLKNEMIESYANSSAWSLKEGHLAEPDQHSSSSTHIATVDKTYPAKRDPFFPLTTFGSLKPEPGLQSYTETSHSCKVCGKKFRDSFTLNQHMSIHTGEKRYSCHICGKEYGYKGTLTRHMLLHSSDKSITCTLCDKQFYRKFDLNRHMKVHYGEKKFSCNVCKKLFRVKYNLNRHMEVHLGKRLSHSILHRPTLPPTETGNKTRLAILNKADETVQISKGEVVSNNNCIQALSDAGNVSDQRLDNGSLLTEPGNMEIERSPTFVSPSSTFSKIKRELFEDCGKGPILSLNNKGLSSPKT